MTKNTKQEYLNSTNTLLKAIILGLFTILNSLPANAESTGWIKYEPTKLVSLMSGEEVVVEHGPRLTLFYFLASWCDTCNQTTQIVKYLDQQYAPLGLKTVLVYLHEPQEDAKKHYQKIKLGKEAFLGNEDIIKKFYNPIAPTIFIVDRKGQLTAQFDQAGQLSELSKLVMLSMSY